jgi:hypothetical protein
MKSSCIFIQRTSFVYDGWSLSHLETGREGSLGGKALSEYAKNLNHREHKVHRDFLELFSVFSPGGTEGRCVHSVVEPLACNICVFPLARSARGD